MMLAVAELAETTGHIGAAGESSGLHYQYSLWQHRCDSDGKGPTSNHLTLPRCRWKEIFFAK